MFLIMVIFENIVDICSCRHKCFNGPFSWPDLQIQPSNSGFSWPFFHFRIEFGLTLFVHKVNGSGLSEAKKALKKNSHQPATAIWPPNLNTTCEFGLTRPNTVMLDLVSPIIYLYTWTRAEWWRLYPVNHLQVDGRAQESQAPDPMWLPNARNFIVGLTYESSKLLIINLIISGDIFLNFTSDAWNGVYIWMIWTIQYGSHSTHCHIFKFLAPP